MSGERPARAGGAAIAEIESIYHSHYQRFLRFAVANLGEIERARDAVHETFVRALRSRGDFRREGALESWLWKILVNVCSLEKRHPATLLKEEPRVDESELDHHWPEIRAALVSLPRRQRTMLFLRHYADLNYEQIAQVLDVSRGTVAATLHAAHGRLRDALEEVKR